MLDLSSGDDPDCFLSTCRNPHQKSGHARTLTLLPIVAVGLGTGGIEFMRVETAALLPSWSPSLSVRDAAEVGAVYGVLGLLETGLIAMKTPWLGISFPTVLHHA